VYTGDEGRVCAAPGNAETLQKPRWRTRYANAEKIHARSKRSAAVSRRGKVVSRGTGRGSRGRGGVGYERLTGFANPQARGWQTRYANMEKYLGYRRKPKNRARGVVRAGGAVMRTA
jgi:hypothetical protein